MFRYIRFALVVILPIILLQHMVVAQSEINIGDTLEEVAEDEILTYTLPLSEGDSIVIDVVTEAFSSLLVLRDPDGDKVAEDESSGDSFRDSRIIYIAPDDGDYEISVEASFGDPEGDFSLSVAETTITTLEYGDEVEIDATGEQQVYFMFEGSENDVINLFAEADSDDDNLRLEIRDDDGTLLSSNDNGGPDRDPYVRRFELPDDGVYRVFAEVFSDDGLQGDFELTLEETDHVVLTEEEVEFELGDDFDYEVFIFEADSGELYNIVLKSDDEEAEARIELIASGNTFADQSITVSEFVEISYFFEASNNGQTRIIVNDRTFDGGLDYTISITLVEEE